MLFDLSLTLDDALPSFEGDPRFRLTRASRIEAEGYDVGALNMGTHGGTHVDAERHVLPDGCDAASTPLSAFVGEALVSHAAIEGGFAIVPESAFAALGRGDIALFHTGWDEKFGGESYLTGFPGFREADMRRLIGLGVKALGTDLPSVEAEFGGIHRLLLGAGVVLIESLTGLAPLLNRRCFFCAAPLKLRGGDGSPVRAFAIV